MNTNNTFGGICLGAALGVLFVARSTLAQDAWSTVDYVGIPVEYRAIATAPPSKVVVMYSEYDTNTWMLKGRTTRRSLDGGATWGTTGHDLAALPVRERGLVLNSAGHLFLLVRDLSFSDYPWMVQSSVDDGASWTVIDDWQFMPGLPSYATGIAVDDADNLYVSGHGVINGHQGDVGSFVRRSTDGGKSWELVDEWRGPLGIRAENAKWITATSSGVFVAGHAVYGVDSSGYWVWAAYIRGSTDGGNTWQTIADFPIGVGENFHDLKTDATGNLYASFTQDVTDGHGSRPLLRRSTDGGINWETYPILPHWSSNVWGQWHLAIGQNGHLLASGGLLNESGWPISASIDGGVSWTKSNAFAEGLWSNDDWPVLAADGAGHFFAFGRQGQGSGPQYRSGQFVRRLSPAPDIPRLQITFQSTTLQLTWPAIHIGFVLQSATTVANGGDWGDLALVPELEEDQNAVTLNWETPGARFFRLRKP